MAKIKYDFDHIKFMALFEQITRTSLKDCIIDENQITFIIKGDNVGKAVGKKGSNVKLLENKLGKKIRIVKFDDNCAQFTQNLIYPLRNVIIEKEDNEIIITGPDTKTKALLIGRNSQNLRKLEYIIKRYFDIGKIKVK
ncbi:NusA-like transcription termination signal-binding factor [Candidatus Woesearchaeota archaeon]|jgi:N utilization substance protein A|nr:NusA-like transcription termination signal-binding factor [Candidatus Woesearchaeota archaeon]